MSQIERQSKRASLSIYRQTVGIEGKLPFDISSNSEVASSKPDFALNQSTSCKLAPPSDRKISKFTPDLLHKSEVKHRGWTETLINKFMPSPDETRPNPAYPNAGSPMKLYKISRIEEIESSAEFLVAKQKTDIRKASAKKAVETKLAKMDDYIANLKLEVKKIDKEELHRLTLDNLGSLHPEWDNVYVTDRHCVNFLRHRATRYEWQLRKIARQTGNHKAYYAIKKMVLNAIGQEYPWLAEECRNQIEKAESNRMQTSAYLPEGYMHMRFEATRDASIVQPQNAS